MVEYSGSMKPKTSVTLTAATLAALDAAVGAGASRSQVIEQAVVEYLERRERAQRELRDLEILDRAAEELNREAEDVLAYQVNV